MSPSRPTARQLARPLARGVVAAPQFDTDAAAWFAAAEAAGGVFASAGYDEGTTKRKLNAFFVELKSLGVWASITELGIIGVGVGNLSAAFVKAKYISVAVLTNSNFVVGDLTSSGSSAGLKGNGTTKFLSTGVNQNSMSNTSASGWVYVTNAVTPAATVAMIGGNANPGFHILVNATNDVSGRMSGTNSLTVPGSNFAKGFIGFNRGDTSTVNWRVGASSGSVSSVNGVIGSSTISIFARAGANPCPSAIAIYGFGGGTSLSSIRTACDNLMISFGFTP